MHRQGYSNRAAARSAVRNATVRRSLARGRVPDGAAKKPQRMLRLFCCTIPFGTDSHFAQALVFVSRGLVAKNGCGFVGRGHD